MIILTKEQSTRPDAKIVRPPVLCRFLNRDSEPTLLHQAMLTKKPINSIRISLLTVKHTTILCLQIEFKKSRLMQPRIKLLRISREFLKCQNLLLCKEPLRSVLGDRIQMLRDDSTLIDGARIIKYNIKGEQNRRLYSSSALFNLRSIEGRIINHGRRPSSTLMLKSMSRPD